MSIVAKTREDPRASLEKGSIRSSGRLIRDYISANANIAPGEKVIVSEI